MAVTHKVYNATLSALTLPTATMNLGTDAIAVRLMGSGFTFDAANTVWTDVSANEIAGGNGYTAGGQTLANQTFARVGGVLTLDADDVVWNASGGDIGPAYAAVLVDTTDGDKLVAAVEFGGAQTAGDGTPFKITWDANGILQIGTAAALGV
jgi:hypothetical protein